MKGNSTRISVGLFVLVMVGARLFGADNGARAVQAASRTPTLRPTSTPTYVRPSATPTVVTIQTYTVQRGDTLSAIAKHFGSTVAALAAYNNIANPSLIRVGQVLRIPPPGQVAPTPAPTATAARPTMTEARVVDVVDGDTIKVSIAGQVYTVRYIGIDTPETVHPSQPVQWMGPEASAANKALVGDQTVYLEKDVSETDKYDRLLRYVWLADGRMVNEELCRQGYAQSSSYPPDIKYQDRFVAAVQEARSTGRGLWGAAPEPTPVPQPLVRSGPVIDIAPTQTSNSCDPSYPTVCIPPSPPDLNCGDIPYRRFQVVGIDPHGFDRDGDGVGCESG